MKVEVETEDRVYSYETLQMIKNRFYIIGKEVKNKTLLDIGCGSGLGVDYLFGQGLREYTGIDLSVSNLKKAKKNITNKNITLQNIDFLKMKERKYDVIIAMQVLQYITIKPFLTKMKNMLNTKGTLIVSIPNFDRKDGFVKSKLSKAYYSYKELSSEFSKLGKTKVYGVFKVSVNKSVDKKITLKNKISKVLYPFSLFKKLINFYRVYVLKKGHYLEKMKTSDIWNYGLDKIYLDEINENNYMDYKIYYVIVKR